MFKARKTILGKIMSKPNDITEDQIKEIVKYLKHWDKRTAFQHGYWFKLLNDGKEIEIYNEPETTIWLYRLQSTSI